ncbi:hypothetical protein FRC06_011195 [Ceratobasidium sp. 370]|nr:hypothetical protein FRC06_011195 [Ceratobasidium sp. 370]
MGNKKNAKKSANTKNSTTDPSEDSSGENSSDSGAHLDGSDYSWLAEENLEYVDDPELYRKCRAVVDKVYEEGLDYGYFNWAVNYGNKYKESRTDKVLQRARSEFRGDHLIPMLRNVRFPPRAETKGPRTKGAAESIDKFALSLTARRLREEMRDFEEDYENIKPEALSQQDCLKSLSFDALEARFVVMIICATAYQLSSHNNAFQRLLGYYFKAKHVPKTIIDMLSSLNLCMSYRSVTATLSTLSQSIRQAALEAVQNFPFLIVHDNIRIKKAVRSQRCDNQTMTDNGTAMTVIILPESARPAWEDPEEIRALNSHIERRRALGTSLRITAKDIFNAQRQERVLEHKLGHIFDILRAIPCLKGAAALSHHRLQRLPSWHQLKSGPDHVTRQFMLATRPIDESSYSGNLMVIQDIMRQLGFDSGDQLVRLALERIIAWVGDELTISRLRMLKWLRQEEKNAYDRLDPFVPLFGWFHALMCLAFCVFENHRGSIAGLGLARTVNSLQRLGFSVDMRRTRPDYHTVKECLMHDFESRVRDLWLEETGTKTLEELNAWIRDPVRTPEDIFAAGKHIQRTRVSRQALPLYQAELRCSGRPLDAVFVESLLQNRHEEMFWDLRHAVKHGDVGHIEDLVPDLLVFFTGSRNTNYARQMYELLQTLYYESTDKMRYAIRENCWLVNMTGRPNGFYPVDQRQELNNGGIRSHGPAPQSGATWDDLAIASPLIPLYMDIVKHVKDSIARTQYSRVHKDPAWEKDLDVLMHDHALTQVMVPVPGREVPTTSKPCKDFFKLGSTILQDSDALDKYTDQRTPFFESRVTKNDFSNYFQPPSRTPSEQPEPSQNPSELPETPPEHSSP